MHTSIVAVVGCDLLMEVEGASGGEGVGMARVGNIVAFLQYSYRRIIAVVTIVSKQLRTELKLTIFTMMFQ